ncbi:hypothetical protein [Flavobacterium sp. GNP002]
MAQTPQEYHEDEASHGNYQYTPLSEVIDGLLIDRLEEDSYIKNTNRNILIYHAKMGLKELIRKVAKETLAIEMTIGNDACIVLPQDYVSGASVSVVVVDSVTGARKLFPLDRNNNMITAVGILQDNDAKILFDSDGNIITADASNVYNMPHTSYEYVRSCNDPNAFIDGSVFSANGEYKVDTINGKIVFDSRLIDQEIVLKYKSDGLQWEYLQETEIRVPKYLEQVLKDWTYYATIEKRQNVPINEKRRALDRYKTTRFEAKKSASNINMKRIAREMRSKSKF